MGIYSVKPKFQQTLTPIKNYFVSKKVNPDLINLGGLLSAIFLGLILYLSSEQPLLLLLVPPLAFIRTALNALDGLVSRELGIASGFGEVLNEYSDRVSDAVIFLGIILSGLVDLRLGCLTMTIILLNSYLSIVSKAAGGKRQYGGLMGKADRMIYLSIFAIVSLLFNIPHIWDYFLAFILIGTLITMYQRFMQIKKELK